MPGGVSTFMAYHGVHVELVSTCVGNCQIDVSVIVPEEAQVGEMLYIEEF